MKAKELIKILEAVSPDETVFVEPGDGARERIKKYIVNGGYWHIVGVQINENTPALTDYSLFAVIKVDTL